MRDINTMEGIELGMTNFDHTIDEGLASELQSKPNAFAQYSGWNFCGYVWFASDKYVCQVWQYNSPREEMEADTLEEIMDKVSSDYGYD